MFVGSVQTLAVSSPEIPPVAWVRWNFNNWEKSGESKMETKLQGTFVNLFNSTIFDGECKQALCSKEDTCSFYKNVFGNSSNMFLYWDPDMHAATDSELVRLLRKIEY